MMQRLLFCALLLLGLAGAGQAFTLQSVVILAPYTNTVTTNLDGLTTTVTAIDFRGVPNPRYGLGGLKVAVERSKADYAY